MSLPINDELKNSKKTFIGILIGTVFITALAGCASGDFRSIPVTLLWALACFATGTCLGFLFGIPKVLQQDSEGSDNSGPNKLGKSSKAYRQLVNTNLIEISDWLTKIIVGLGLINFGKIPSIVLGVATIFAQAITGGDPSKGVISVAVAVIVSYTATGLLFGYLITRLYLASAFHKADSSQFSAIDAARAAGGAVESLQDAVAAQTVRLNSLTKEISSAKQVPAERGNTENLSKEVVAPSLAHEHEDSLSALARMYNQFSAPTREARVIGRNDISAKMGALINTEPSLREWIFNSAMSLGDDGLIVGLATAINSEPQKGDNHRLAKLAKFVKYKHGQYKVSTAIGRLFDSGIATEQDVGCFLEALSSYYKDSDASLRRRIAYTIAQISKAVGENPNVTAFRHRFGE